MFRYHVGRHVANLLVTNTYEGTNVSKIRCQYINYFVLISILRIFMLLYWARLLPVFPHLPIRLIPQPLGRWERCGSHYNTRNFRITHLFRPLCIHSYTGVVHSPNYTCNSNNSDKRTSISASSTKALAIWNIISSFS